MTKTVISGLALAAILLLSACNGQNGRNSTKDSPLRTKGQHIVSQAYITFDTLHYDFGTIIEGEQVVGYFDYKNTGTDPLLILSVRASCGCTTPEWSQEPLEPGERETLNIIFDAGGRRGSQHKEIIVHTNAENGEVSLAVFASVK